MSNEYKDWLEDRKCDAFDAINQIAPIYDDYHNYSEEAFEKIGDILRKYEFID